MPRFAQLAFTPRVRARQARHGSRQAYARFDQDQTEAVLGPDEAAFVTARDHFFLASVGETGWPYVQHRGGPAGFLQVLGPRTLAFAEARGNRQYVTLGNLEGDARVALFLWDQPRRQRLKILGRARVVEADEDEALLARLARAMQLGEGPPPRIERAVVIEVEAFDWNCPQHITPRWTESEVARAIQPLRERIATLEAELAEARQAAGLDGVGSA